METRKAQNRREREGFFEKYCTGDGLDIGSGSDPLITPYGTVRPYDKQHGDANLLNGIDDNSFDFVYSSHCLEHLDTPHIALQNWFRVVKPGGHLIVVVPHRDLYEKKLLLPSRWNTEHKSFWLPVHDEPPHTFGLQEFIDTWLWGESYEVLFVKVCDDGWDNTPANVHANGEYSIECVIKKL